MEALRKAFGSQADLAVIALVIGVLVVLFVPIPAGLLDFLILCNVSFALLLLLLTFYMARPVEFSTFPSLLLVATLFRLALNIAATRLILSQGEAGRVIGAIGSFVVGGNYVIGLIVFLILIVVQYVVVTNGSQRVSEVAARFTLDSMPGQQMSIDADLNMGFIDPEEAQRRRKNLSREAAFYGAMDGASKFVKGDAVAGIIIMLINIVGGLVIGVMQMGMPWGEALRSFTLLTIGDGIATQVPALVISVGTGLIVTRSASDANLGTEVVRQLSAFARPTTMVAIALLAVSLMPGLPALPALALAGFWFAISAMNRKRAEAQDAAPATAGTPEDESPYAALAVDPVEVLVGAQLVPLVGNDDPLIMERLASFRRQYAQESGLVLPHVRLRDAARLAPNGYEIQVFGTQVAHGELQPDHVLALHPSGQVGSLRGIATREPTYGLPAVWIADAEREAARQLKYTLVDPATVFMTHLCEVLRKQAPVLLTRKETERLLGTVRERQPGLVEELVPTQLAVGDVQKVLQNLLREQVSIRHIEAIVETLADQAKHVKDAALLTEQVRQRLGPAICQGLAASNVLQVLTLDPVAEQKLLQNVRAAESGDVLGYEPQLADRLVHSLAQHAERMMKGNLLPVVLCPPELRRHLRTWCERMVPHLRVVALTEVPATLELRAFGTVTF